MNCQLATMLSVFSLACVGSSCTAPAAVGGGATTMVAAAPVTPAPEPPDSSTARVPKCKDEPGMAYLPAGRTAFRSTRVKAREANVSALWLDRYETTVEEYRACVEAGACTPPYASESGYTDAAMNPLVCTWDITGVENLPINCVDGVQHDAYCAWRGKRPPFSHELHWAARGRDRQTLWPWGDEPVTCDLAITDENGDDDVFGCGLGRPWPVGSRPAGRSRDGIYDLVGNIAEYAHSPFREDRHGELREACGGSWHTRTFPTGFMGCSPGGQAGFTDKLGFRCALDPGPLPPCTVAP